MTCTSDVVARQATHVASSRLREFLHKAWLAYWDWQGRRATVRILHSLDARTLRDIGLSKGEINSVVYGRPEENRRHYTSG